MYRGEGRLNPGDGAGLHPKLCEFVVERQQAFTIFAQPAHGLPELGLAATPLRHPHLPATPLHPALGQVAVAHHRLASPLQALTGHPFQVARQLRLLSLGDQLRRPPAPARASGQRPRSLVVKKPSA